jgi:hypothetical protein
MFDPSMQVGGGLLCALRAPEIFPNRAAVFRITARRQVVQNLQRGLGAFGTLVILIAAGAGGYYVYKAVMEPDSVSAPSCKSQLNSCIAICRKTTTEAPAAQECQDTCQRNASACEAKR